MEHMSRTASALGPPATSHRRCVRRWDKMYVLVPKDSETIWCIEHGFVFDILYIRFIEGPSELPGHEEARSGYMRSFYTRLKRLHVTQILKARLRQEAAMLSTFQPQPFLAITFLKGGLKFVEEEEAYLMKAMQTMKMPIANVDMAQDKKDAQEVGAQGRCFANSSNHKKISNRIPAQAEGSRAGSNSPRNSSSFSYTQHLLMVKSSLLLYKQKMMAREKERANGSSSRGKGCAVEDIFRGYTNSQTVKSSLLRHKQKMMARKRETHVSGCG